jgi:hypothetical protein
VETFIKLKTSILSIELGHITSLLGKNKLWHSQRSMKGIPTFAPNMSVLKLKNGEKCR